MYSRVKNLKCNLPAQLVAGCLLMMAFGQSASANECTSLAQIQSEGGGFGANDYTDAALRREKLHIVENAHFTAPVRQLQRGESTSDPMDDIAYTLRKWPNHHEALYAMVRYHLIRRAETGRGPVGWRSLHSHRSAECWLQRAETFAPKDPTVRMIYGLYDHKTGNPASALQRYERAIEVAPNSAEAHYNIGLVYTDLKRFEDARKHAYVAYSLGYPLPGLKRKLTRLGEWQAAPEAESNGGD